MKANGNQKLIAVAAVALAIGAAGGYFAGTSVSKQADSRRPGQFAANFDGTRMGDRTGTGMTARGGTGRNLGLTRGEVLQVGEGSLTVKLPDGGSRVVLFDDSVQVTSCSAGDSSLLQAGQQVMANGSVGSDGSVAAQTIQIVPEWMGGQFGGRMQPQEQPTETPKAE